MDERQVSPLTFPAPVPPQIPMVTTGIGMFSCDLCSISQIVGKQVILLLCFQGAIRKKVSTVLFCTLCPRPPPLKLLRAAAQRLGFRVRDCALFTILYTVPVRLVNYDPWRLSETWKGENKEARGKEKRRCIRRKDNVPLSGLSARFHYFHCKTDLFLLKTLAQFRTFPFAAVNYPQPSDC